MSARTTRASSKRNTEATDMENVNSAQDTLNVSSASSRTKAMIVNGEPMKKSDIEEMEPLEVTQKLPEFIESIDKILDPIFDDDEAEFYDTDAYKMTYELFEKLYEARLVLDALNAAIPALKDTIKDREEEAKKKDIEVAAALQPIAEQVKNNTLQMKRLSEELNKVKLPHYSKVGAEPQKSYSALSQKSDQRLKTSTPPPHPRPHPRSPPPTNVTTVKSAVREILHNEDRKKNIILFGLEENDSKILKNEVCNVLQEINQKPVVGQVVRLGRSTARCRPVRVSLMSSDTVHDVLRCSTMLKDSNCYNKVFIGPDRNPQQRIKHNELVCEMKTMIQSDRSKHWKIGKGKVFSVDEEAKGVSKVTSAINDATQNQI